MTEVSDEMNELMDIRRQCRLNQWSMMVQEREDSGLSIRAYCEQKGIGVKTYYYRLKKLREAAVELTQPEIVQVEAPEILEQKSIVIQSGNTSIEIPGNANPETVRVNTSPEIEHRGRANLAVASEKMSTFVARGVHFRRIKCAAASA